MDDNAICHRTVADQDCLDSEGIQRLVWPAGSPDLNSIESVWIALGRKVAGRNYPPTNKNTLIRALTEEWDKLPQQLLDNVVQNHFEEICLKYQPFTNRRQLKRGSIPTIFVFKKKASSRRILDRCKPSTSVMEMEPSTGSQTDTFGEVIDVLSQKDIAIKKLISTKEINFIPENICDDTHMKCVTSFTIKEFYCIYRFLQIEDDLSMGTKIRPLIDSTVSRDFNFVTDVLYEKLELQDVFPSKDQVIRYMPPPFRMYCKNVRMIVDCTKIEVQKPSSPHNGATNDIQSFQKC
ncbi:THAP-type domain-containing protein [Trichonephila clavipes]|nr:THAP-type domain-containing protein [Trichonephila clavipes]